MQPVTSFDKLFAPVRFAGKILEGDTVNREKVLAHARLYFNAYIKAPAMTDAYIPKGSGYELSNGETPSGKTTFFLPWPVLTPVTRDISRKYDQTLMLRRLDMENGTITDTMESDEYAAYFHTCQPLGEPLAAKWVWLSRCIAPNQHILLPFTNGVNHPWTQMANAGGNMLAQGMVISGDKYVVPDQTADNVLNKDFWAIMFSGAREPDPIPDLTHLEASIRADLVPAPPTDMTVPVFMVPSYRVSDGGYSTETRDAPARNKPSAVAEIAGAVAVAAAVSLVTGVVAAVV